jgi:hypothetical protein
MSVEQPGGLGAVEEAGRRQRRRTDARDRPGEVDDADVVDRLRDPRL